MMKKNKSQNTIVLFIVAFLALFLIGAVVAQDFPIRDIAKPAVNNAGASNVDEFQVYENKDLNIALKYPKDWVINVEKLSEIPYQPILIKVHPLNGTQTNKDSYPELVLSVSNESYDNVVQRNEQQFNVDIVKNKREINGIVGFQSERFSQFLDENTSITNYFWARVISLPYQQGSKSITISLYPVKSLSSESLTTEAQENISLLEQIASTITF